MIAKIVGVVSILVTVAAFAFWNGDTSSTVKSNTKRIDSMEKKINIMYWNDIIDKKVKIPKELQ